MHFHLQPIVQSALSLSLPWMWSENFPSHWCSCFSWGLIAQRHKICVVSRSGSFSLPPLSTLLFLIAIQLSYVLPPHKVVKAPLRIFWEAKGQSAIVYLWYLHLLNTLMILSFLTIKTSARTPTSFLSTIFLSSLWLRVSLNKRLFCLILASHLYFIHQYESGVNFHILEMK